MNVYVVLIVISLDHNQIYTMLKNGTLPIENLDNFKNSFCAVEHILKESMNVVGRWAELHPVLLGTLDDIDRKDNNGNRKISLIYHVSLPSKNTINDNYEWVDIADLDSHMLNEEDKSIIRYSILNSWSSNV